jgi:ABC-2 type transport system ATP-binding protein
MQRLAGEGRTVLVSSHLLSEMALTATELVVIGRGRLVAEGPTQDFIDGSAEVLVRGPQRDALAVALRAAGFAVTEESAALVVAGADTERVGEAVGAAGLVLHELSLRRGSLEEAFMEITKQDVEYATGVSA